jgi:hypothetical protein
LGSDVGDNKDTDEAAATCANVGRGDGKDATDVGAKVATDVAGHAK